MRPPHSKEDAERAKLRQRLITLALLFAVCWALLRRQSASTLDDSYGPPSGKPTSDLHQWARRPDDYAYKPWGSKCLVKPGGWVQLPPKWNSKKELPFILRTDNYPPQSETCAHCKDSDHPMCCGVCVTSQCDMVHPGKGVQKEAEQQLLNSPYHFRELTPCELFARIRGRTLWFVGDSQMRIFHSIAECFLREFAPSLQRIPPLPKEQNLQLLTVKKPREEPPICLQLALGTRVCVIRVDYVHDLIDTVLPKLLEWVPNFQDDIFLYNTGLHYVAPGRDGQPLNKSDMARGLATLAAWWPTQAERLPRLIWMDTAVQHFDTQDGAYPGGTGPFECVPLKSWYEGDPLVRAGGSYNLVASPIIQAADGHLRTWNASIPLWRSHQPSDCTHWCNPSAYHLWLYLLNNVLRDRGIGNEVYVPERAAGIHAEQAAVAAAAASEEWPG